VVETVAKATQNTTIATCDSGTFFIAHKYASTAFVKNTLIAIDLYGGRCRIRTCDFHSVNLASANVINDLHGNAGNHKSLKKQTEHNKVDLIVQALCMRDARPLLA